MSHPSWHVSIDISLHKLSSNYWRSHVDQPSKDFESCDTSARPGHVSLSSNCAVHNVTTSNTAAPVRRLVSQVANNVCPVSRAKARRTKTASGSSLASSLPEDKDSVHSLLEYSCIGLGLDRSSRHLKSSSQRQTPRLVYSPSMYSPAPSSFASDIFDSDVSTGATSVANNFGFETSGNIVTLPNAVYVPVLKANPDVNKDLPLAPRFSYCAVPDIPRNVRLQNVPQRSSDTTTHPALRSTPSEQHRNMLGRRLKPLPKHYEGPYLGDPCTSKCLDHLLGCGHKIITPRVEPCALNCHLRDEPDLAHPRNLDSRFMCMACVADHMQQRQQDRIAKFRAELEEHVESDAWVVQQLSYLMEAWQGHDIEEIRRHTEKHRPCGALYINPDHRGVVEQVMRVMESSRLQHSRNASVGSLTSASTVSSISMPPTRQNSMEQYQRKTLASPRFAKTSPASSALPYLRSSVTSMFKPRGTSTARTASSQAWHLDDEVWSPERSRPASSASSVYSRESFEYKTSANVGAERETSDSLVQDRVAMMQPEAGDRGCSMSNDNGTVTPGHQRSGKPDLSAQQSLEDGPNPQWI